MDKWLNHPTAIKIMSLVIGIIMWAVVHFDPDSTPNNVASLLENHNIDGVKIEAYGLDEKNYVLKGLDPQTVKLTVRGTRTNLNAARKEDYRIRVDLRSVTEGVHTLSLQLDLPQGIQLVQMTPGSVKVTVESLQTKEFEVDVQTKGVPAQGYIAGTPIVRPTNRVHVTLPENTLAQVSRVGASISVDGETSAIKNKAVKLAAYDKNGKVIEGAYIDPAVVEVEVPITYPFKTVPLQFVMKGRMPPGLSIDTFQPDAEQVTIYGPKEALDQIDFIEADIELKDLAKSGKIPITLAMPNQITEMSPDKINVDVSVVLSDTRTLEGLPINFKGLGEGMSVKIVQPATGKADIVVTGSPARLGKLQPGDVTVDADLSGKGPGTYDVNLIVNSPRFIEQSGGVSTATVEIAADVPATVSPEENASGGETSGGSGGSAGNDAGAGAGGSGSGSGSTGDGGSGNGSGSKP
ncbi:CdaR family protein [Cohnella caldifontis]|uniref:CdaR family protein n=1 Tax=Cohnella caldifontis TaxID=3027471 RepID=UPI0023ED2E58|nr:CdaR family protein [Cohnella sp. YIM B05605]